MNSVFLSGMVTSVPVLRMESGEIPHLTFGLSVRHRTRAGEFRSEAYRVSAWYSAARWGAEKLSRGQITGIQGYLTQRKISRDGSPAFATEIVAEEFLFVHPARANASAQASPAVTAAGSNKKHDSGFTTAAPASMMAESAAVEAIAAEPAPMQAG